MWAAGIASHSGVRPRHVQKCFTELPPRDGDSSLGEAERLATELPAPIPRLGLVFAFLPKAVCVTPGDKSQPAAATTDVLRNFEGRNQQESGTEEGLYTNPRDSQEQRTVPVTAECRTLAGLETIQPKNES